MRAFAFLALVACGSNGSNPAKKLDASIDAPPDARPDAPPDAPLDADYPVDAPTGHFYYIIDHQNVPTNNTQARADGLDLNGDGTIDNQFGMVLGTLSSMGFDVQGAVDTSIDHGQTLMLVDIDALDFQNTTGATYTMYDGADPYPPPCNGSADTTCRHHLAGTGIFDIDPSSPKDTPLAGKAVSGTFTFGPGHLPIELAFLSSTAPTKLDLIGARTKLTGVSATGVISGIVAGGISQTDIDTKVIPQWQVQFTAIVVRDCCGSSTSPGGATCNPNANPACGCTSGSTGQTLLGLFDTNPKDCTISVTEIQNNSLIMSLLAPDVTLEGQMALSFGMQITAVPASIKF